MAVTPIPRLGLIANLATSGSERRRFTGVIAARLIVMHELSTYSTTVCHQPIGRVAYSDFDREILGDFTAHLQGQKAMAYWAQGLSDKDRNLAISRMTDFNEDIWAVYGPFPEDFNTTIHE